MTESTTSHDDFPAADNATRHANMLRRAIKRFRDNVRLSDLQTIATDCGALVEEIETLSEMLNRIEANSQPEDYDTEFL
jgi:hypothetical protein